MSDEAETDLDLARRAARALFMGYHADETAAQLRARVRIEWRRQFGEKPGAIVPPWLGKILNEVEQLTYDTVLGTLKKSWRGATNSITVSPCLFARASELLLSKMRVTDGGYVCDNLFALTPWRIHVDVKLTAGEWHLGDPK